MLDAFRYDYLTEARTPFLWKCAQTGEYYTSVEQSLGFCERSEILTGLRGDETGFFTAICFDPPNSPYTKVPWMRFLNAVEETALFFSRLCPRNSSAQLHEKLRYLISYQFRKMGITMPAYFIPYPWLPYFALTEDRIDHRSPAAFQTPSIIALLDEAGRSYFYDTFTALNFHTPYQSDSDRLDAVIRDVKRSPKELYLVYIAALDIYGHHYGPDSPEFQDVLYQLDIDLGRFTQNLERIIPGNRYLFLGDHGMITVIKRIDAEKEISHLLRSVHLRKGQDVLYFLDSTMVRLWAISDKARCLLSDVLTTSEMFNGNGAWMDDATARRNHAPWPDRRYGDYLWVANPGTLVFPDYFHRSTPCKGMHGYDPHLPESHGMCINWGRGIPSSKHAVMPLIKTFDMLKRNLEL